MFQKIALILLLAGSHVQANEFSGSTKSTDLSQIKNNILMASSESTEEPTTEDPLAGDREPNFGPDSTEEPAWSSGDGGYDSYPGHFKVTATVSDKSRSGRHSSRPQVEQTDLDGKGRTDNVTGPDSTEKPTRGAGEPSGGYSLGGGFTTPDSPVFSEKVSLSLVEKAQSLIGSDIEIEDQIRNGTYAAFFSAYGLRLVVNFIKKKGVETSIKAIPRFLGAAVAIGGYVGSASASADLPGYTTAADSFINQSPATVVKWANINEEFATEVLGIMTYLDNEVCHGQELSEEAAAYCY